MATNFLSRVVKGPEKKDDSIKRKRPGMLYSVCYIMYRLHSTTPLEHESPTSLIEQAIGQVKLGLHVTQRTARILMTVVLRLVRIRHPLGWTLAQVPAWRAFFSGVGDLQAWVPLVKQQVVTGSCSSWWLSLPQEGQPHDPKTRVVWVFLHGGAFVAGDALMYQGVFAYWLLHLAKQGVDCSILSVDYPLAPEHPFPAGVEAAAGVVKWLLEESGEAADYFVGGDSAGGNLALAGLSLLRVRGELSRPPLALTLISPAVDLSNSSVFAKSTPVSSHFSPEQQGPAAAYSGASPKVDQAPQHEQHACSRSKQQNQSNKQRSSAHLDDDGLDDAPACTSSGGSSSSSSYCSVDGTLEQQLQQRQQQWQELQHQHQHQLEHKCEMHARHSAGGSLTPLSVVQGVASELVKGIKVHSSRAAAEAEVTTGWFDYLPADSIADELHCYLHDTTLLTDPLVSPTYIKDFTGLCQKGMLLVAGGAEVMRRDIATFAGKATAAGVDVVYHEEPNEPHVFPMLAMPHLLRKGLVVPKYVAAVACGQRVSSNQGSK